MKTTIEVGGNTKKVIMVTQLYVCWRWSDLFIFRGYIYLEQPKLFTLSTQLDWCFQHRTVLESWSEEVHIGDTRQGSFKSDCHHQRKLNGNRNQPSVTTLEVYLCATFSNNNNWRFVIHHKKKKNKLEQRKERSELHVCRVMGIGRAQIETCKVCCWKSGM